MAGDLSEAASFSPSFCIKVEHGGVSSTTSVLVSPSSLPDSSCIVQASGYQEGLDNIDQICTPFYFSPLARRKTQLTL